MKYYQTENFLEDFYLAIANEDTKLLEQAHIPRSEVIYVRAHLRDVFGKDFSVDYVERCLYLEGMLEAKDVLDPHRKRDWEVNGDD